MLVQDIKSQFAVEVYELNTRIALKHADLLQFNECLTKLLQLYTQFPISNINNGKPLINSIDLGNFDSSKNTGKSINDKDLKNQANFTNKVNCENPQNVGNTSERRQLFMMVRALHFGFTGMSAELQQFLGKLDFSDMRSEPLQLALQLIEAVNSSNAFPLLSLLKANKLGLINKNFSEAEIFASELLVMFAERLTIWTLKILSSAFFNKKKR